MCYELMSFLVVQDVETLSDLSEGLLSGWGGTPIFCSLNK